MIVRKLHMQQGVSIVEALVALVVISAGMLGIAVLYLSSLQASRTAKLRSQAVELVASISDRIRANRDAAISYNSAAYGGNPALQTCHATRCTAAQLAQDDLARWLADARAALPGGNAVTATVAVTDRASPNSDNYVMTLTWREANAETDYQYRVSMNLENR